MVTRGEIVRNKVSELMDGELDSTDAAQIISAVKNDSNLFSEWKIYHAIGDSLRQSAINIDISEQVRNQLANEPFLLSPSPYPHKAPLNRKQKLLSLSIAASIAALSAGWLISQSIDQQETTLKEVYMAENPNGKSTSAVGHRPLLTFQPASAYSSPSMSVSTHYNNDPLIYRELIYEKSARSPSTGISSSAEVAGEQAAAPAE